MMEERRMRTDDQPRSLLYERLLATAWQAHPYRTPVVGWMNDLENMQVDDARDWYRQWYAPNNATLVVVGDVSAQEVVREAQRCFGPIPARALPVRKPMLEPVQNGLRRATLKAPAELPYLLMAWHVPRLGDVDADRDAYALWTLSALLDGDAAARLPRELVRGSQVAVSAGASYDAISRGPSLFVLKASPSPGRTAQTQRRRCASSCAGLRRRAWARTSWRACAPRWWRARSTSSTPCSARPCRSVRWTTPDCRRIRFGRR